MAFAFILRLVFAFSVGFFVAEGESICSVSPSLTCDGCLKVSPDCIWCKDIDLNLAMQSGPSIAPRCASRSQMHEYNCTSWEGLGKGRFEVVEDLPQDSLLQISPQRLKASLRQGETASFNITLSEASTVPLDVYVLMDVTGSMREDLEILKAISNDTINLLQTFSSDVTIGFGTFADKRTLPFYTEVCSRFNPHCVPTYSYRNHLSLTADLGLYLAALNATEQSNSFDTPEGGMDALLQVVVCAEVRVSSSSCLGYRSPS